MIRVSSSRQKKLVYLCHIKLLNFSHILEIFVIAKEEMHHDSYRLIQHAALQRVSPEFKQTENKASNYVVVKCVFSQRDDSCIERKFVNYLVDKWIIVRLKTRVEATILVNETKTKLSKIKNRNTLWKYFHSKTALNNNQCTSLTHTNKKGMPTMSLL